MPAPLPAENPRQPSKPLFPTFRKWFGWIFSWRSVRACLFALVCLGTLIGLFYAVENWRGRWAWNRFKRALEANGEKVNWQSFVPPPVPDDQNFAMTPLLKPILDYEFRPSGAHQQTHWRDTNGANRLWSLSLHRPEVTTSGPPAIRAEWRTGKRIDLAAWQGYFRQVPSPSKTQPPTAPALTNSFPVALHPQAPAQDVLLALSRFGPELAELHAACARPYARFPVHYGEGLGTMLPHVGIMQKVSQIAMLRSVAELEAGRSEPAFQDVQLGFRAADALSTEPFCISHLVRLAIMDRSLQTVWEGLAAHRWSSNQLVSLMDGLKTADLLADYSRVVRSERSLGGFVITFADRNRRTQLLLNMFPGEALHSGFTGMLRYYPKVWNVSGKRTGNSRPRSMSWSRRAWASFPTTSSRASP